MSLRYHLTGTFIEACNCEVICPCWVDDTPDEEFCAGLFAWRLGAGSEIEGIDVSDGVVVSVTVHGDARRGGTSESALYVSDTLPAAAVPHLIEAFAGRGGGPLGRLAGVTGEVVDQGTARVALTPRGRAWEVSVRSATGARLVTVDGSPKQFDGSAHPMRVTDSALHHELGIGEHAVEACATGRLTVDVAALPGAPVDVRGRSGMTGPFRYDSDGSDDPDPHPDVAGAEQDGVDDGD